MKVSRVIFLGSIFVAGLLFLFKDRASSFLGVLIGILLAIIFSHYFNDKITFRLKQYLLIFFMMLLSFVSILFTVFIEWIFLTIFKLESLIILLEKYFSLFYFDKSYVDANTIFFIIIFVFYPAYQIYRFLFIIITSILERNFKENRLYIFLAEGINKELLIVYFTVIVLFMGFLPNLTENLVASEKIVQHLNNLPYSFLVISLLPTAHLLFAKAKNNS
ncbi:hypothetical protein [Sporosarcina sp. Te-1]|uniref:hypothetical protein n=1 Tax=Sporosarcina sp. Te-1 TaxID=2818390 RepID=UPI001A9FD635|nr:hypothetical protein [Sporosarcina sp. Te-1]QTD41956.1 hypothetical protein J3U78_03670 [Sporosarcina sp. Te-1]